MVSWFVCCVTCKKITSFWAFSPHSLHLLYSLVVKTRLQKQVVVPGKEPKYTGLGQACVVIAKEEGFFALWKGITPRLLRISPGQAITFMTYEFVSKKMHQFGLF